MPPRRPARAGSTKPAATDGSDTIAVAQPNGIPKATARKSATPAVNGDATRPPTSAPVNGRGRAKKSVDPPPVEAKSNAAKRKKHDESDIEEESEPAPAPKKTKTKAAPKVVEPAKPKPRGPTRMKGRKVEINALRYTEPLKVFLFGEGSSGELGFGATKKAIDVKRPRFNEALSNMSVVRIAAGGMHVVALTKDNQILTWGVNDNGALGRDTSHVDVKMRDMDADGSDSDSDDDPTGGLNDAEATPTAVPAEYFPPDTTFVDVVAGDSCTFALTTEGALYGWGTFRKNEGVLGFQKKDDCARTPEYIEGMKKVTQIACGTNHVVAIDKDKHVWAWGNGQQNQLGRRVTERTLEAALQPNRVGFHDNSLGKKHPKPSAKMVQVGCGDYHSMAIGDDGHVWAWGANNYAETGYAGNAGDDNANVATPRIILSLEGRQVTSLVGGSHHNLAVTALGELLAWGRCDSSQTGIPMDQLNAVDDVSKVLKGENGKAKILVEPTAVPGLQDIVFATCGPDHNIVLDKNGKAYSWGFSANYQTGQGTLDDIKVPTLIDNTAVKETKLVWGGAGGQYSVLASLKK